MSLGAAPEWRYQVSARVLVIDDDQDFRASVRSLLEGRGYEVFEAVSGHDGLRKVKECKPDVILLDVMMETTEEGYGVVYSLRHRDEYAACRDTPVFMVSSIQESPDERYPMSAETELIRPDRYLTKPLNIPRFFELLEKALPPASRARA
jgi:CheY-like chemotaxis protein